MNYSNSSPTSEKLHLSDTSRQSDLAGIGAWVGSTPGSLGDIEAAMLDTELRLD